MAHKQTMRYVPSTSRNKLRFRIANTPIHIIAFTLDGSAIETKFQDVLPDNPIAKFVLQNSDALFLAYRRSCAKRNLSHGFLTTSWEEYLQEWKNSHAQGGLNPRNFIHFEPGRISDAMFPYVYDFQKYWYVSVIHKNANLIYDIEIPIYN
jgi:hypothetical protein